MGDKHYGAGIGLEVILQPLGRVGVKVVGRLVEEQKFRGLQQKLRQGDAALGAAGKGADDLVRVGELQMGHHLEDTVVGVPAAMVLDPDRELALARQKPIHVGRVRRHLLGELIEARHGGTDRGEAALYLRGDGRLFV